MHRIGLEELAITFGWRAEQECVKAGKPDDTLLMQLLVEASTGMWQQ